MNRAATIDEAGKRRRDLAAIHQLKKELHQDDETYRTMLERVTGSRSSADLDAAQRRAVIAELHRLAGRTEEGAKRRARFLRITAGKPTKIAPDKVALVGKVEALLATAERPWAYAHGLAKRMFGAVRLEWCKPDQLHRLIAALEIDAKRRAKRAAEETSHAGQR